ncbi:apyrase isoform X5 [Musca domestica]|uniref:Apyrase isoform X5 n=1 Tax=Musca domestica TaxID=7370 RepID=A0A9J7IGW7_MUSDO|nr:apyrase isoform X5 [Musca domestica]
MKLLFLFAAIVCLTANLNIVNAQLNPPKSELFPLSIIHINDFHARYEPTDTAGGACESPNECIGGYARTVYTVRQLLEQQKENNVVYFNAGDSFQGTLWYNVGRWNVTSQFLNLLPADAMTLGNHEFDHGVEGVVPFLDALDSPMLVANIDARNEPTMEGKYQPSMIIERSGRKIGVIGVILETTYDLSNTGKLIFRNESETILEEAAKLKAQGANIIIVLSHCGYDVDKLIAEKAGSEIDVIVGSHSHTFLYTGDTPPGPDVPKGDYPTIVRHSPTGHRVLIVQAGAYAKYVGNLTIYFDNDGNVVDYEGAPLYMGSDVPQDITYGQVYSMAPYEAPLVAFDLQGLHLRAALEKSVSRFDNNKYNSSTSFLQVSGLKITYNLRNPVNERVIEVKVRCAACKVPKYEELQDDVIYRIIATRYVATGGYGFSIFEEYGQRAVEYATEFESLMEYVEKFSPLYNGLEDRITLL